MVKMAVQGNLIVDEGEYKVEAVWSTELDQPLDRPVTQQWRVGKNLKLAQRLIEAINDQNYTSAELTCDYEGASYVCASFPWIGRTLNADLKRLGY